LKSHKHLSKHTPPTNPKIRGRCATNEIKVSTNPNTTLPPKSRNPVLTSARCSRPLCSSQRTADPAPMDNTFHDNGPEEISPPTPQKRGRSAGPPGPNSMHSPQPRSHTPTFQQHLHKEDAAY
jgi:hypothetical protein